MNTITQTTARIHPLFTRAAIAVTAVLFAGIAGLTGILPIGQANAQTAAPPAQVATPPATPTAPPPCLNCGVVDGVREFAQEGEGSGLGAVAGGLIGGILGNQVGGGTGKSVATVLGVAGGAYAGHQVEKSQKKTTRYEISVRMNDGSIRKLTQDTLPAWRIGERVRIENDGLVRD